MEEKDLQELEYYRKLERENRLIELSFPLNTEVFEIRSAYCYVSDGVNLHRGGNCPFISGNMCSNTSLSCPEIIITTKATLKNQREWQHNQAVGRTVFKTHREANEALIKKSLREHKHLDM